MLIANRHVFITGAGKRLGRAITDALIPHRIRLSAHYRTSAAEAADAARAAERAGGRAHTVTADLANVEELRAAVRAAEARFGAIDILVNCASDFFPTPLFEVTEAQWDHFLDVNLKGQFFLAQAAATRMQEKGGLILNLADVNGTKPMKNFTPYVISKAGLVMMTRNLAKELAPKIRVNAISPGPVLLPENYTEAQRQRSIDRTLLKRLGSPRDIAEAALFLIENDYINGVELAVDGGRSLA